MLKINQENDYVILFVLCQHSVKRCVLKYTKPPRTLVLRIRKREEKESTKNKKYDLQNIVWSLCLSLTWFVGRVGHKVEVII
jgi:hypothetical protein